MNDFDWIEQTPADQYEVGEKLCFSDNWRHYVGEFIRTEGDYIWLNLNYYVYWGMKLEAHGQRKFHKDKVMDIPRSVDEVIEELKSSVQEFTFTMDTWTIYDYKEEELIDTIFFIPCDLPNECEPHNPRVINYIKRWWFNTKERLYSYYEVMTMKEHIYGYGY